MTVQALQSIRMMWAPLTVYQGSAPGSGGVCCVLALTLLLPVLLC
jgi:hypothetical protein